MKKQPTKTPENVKTRWDTQYHKKQNKKNNTKTDGSKKRTKCAGRHLFAPLHTSTVAWRGLCFCDPIGRQHKIWEHIKMRTEKDELILNQSFSFHHYSFDPVQSMHLLDCLKRVQTSCKESHADTSHVTEKNSPLTATFFYTFLLHQHWHWIFISNQMKIKIQYGNTIQYYC